MWAGPKGAGDDCVCLCVCVCVVGVGVLCVFVCVCVCLFVCVQGRKEREVTLDDVWVLDLPPATAPSAPAPPPAWRCLVPARFPAVPAMFPAVPALFWPCPPLVCPTPHPHAGDVRRCVLHVRVAWTADGESAPPPTVPATCGLWSRRRLDR